MQRLDLLGAGVLALAFGPLASRPADAALPPDVGAGPTVVTLPTPPSKHWVWVNDISYTHMADGGAHLVDGDTGRYLGALSTGYTFSHVVLSRDGKLIYSPEIYLSRGTRGIRADVVTIYDTATLKVLGEVQIPPKRVSNLPTPGNAGLTDDDRFLVIHNFNPAQSVSVVDTASRTFAGEIETPGCSFAFPMGPRAFFSMCADGSFLAVELDDSGHAARQARTEPLFNAADDPVADQPTRVGDTWYFVSRDGRIHTIRNGKKGFEADEPWWLTSKAERAQRWRPGGLQQLAVHSGQNRLYVIMHQGGAETHKDPGQSIWVYDLATHKRVQRIAARHPTGSIKLSSDDHPLLYGAFAESTVLDVYDPSSGKLLRSVTDIGTTPTLLVTP